LFVERQMNARVDFRHDCFDQQRKMKRPASQPAFFVRDIDMWD
jgi:hypothetical protein